MTLRRSFRYVGRYQLFTVPAGVTSIIIDLKGAGGAGPSSTAAGGRLQGTMNVVAGQLLVINVGRCGHNAGNHRGGAGGWNGGGAGGSSVGTGGDSGYGGGGATDIRLGTNARGNRKAVAGGGGGCGSGGPDGGQGGAATGDTGDSDSGGGSGGAGGSASAGGAHGAPGTGTSDSASDGTLAYGGHGSNHSSVGYRSGGGGGGGYYGGGGGGGGNASNFGGGGGGGSNFASGSVMTDVTSTRGAGSPAGITAASNGSASFEYEIAPSRPALQSPIGGIPQDNSATLMVRWAFSCLDPVVVQLEAEVQWRVSSGAWTTVAPAAVDEEFYVFDPDTFVPVAGQMVEWQVRTKGDNGAGYGPWSDSAYFLSTTPGAPATISPMPTEITSHMPGLAWTTAAGMSQWELALFDATGMVQLELVKTTLTGLPTSDLGTVPYYSGFVNGTNYQLGVRWNSPNGVFSDWAMTGPIPSNIDAPLAPTAVVTTSVSPPSVTLAITNPGSDPHPPDHNDVERVDQLTGVSTRIATGVALNGSFTDTSPGFNHLYRYRVVAVTANGAITRSA